MPGRIRVAEMVFSFDVELGGGGITRFTTGLAKKLDPGKFDVMLYSLTDSGKDLSLVRSTQSEGLGIRTLTGSQWHEDKPLQSFVRAVNTLQKALVRNPVDILHSHSEFTDVAALWLKLRAGIPVILRTVHNGHWLEWRKRPWRRLIFSNFLIPLFFNAEIGVSPNITERLDRRWLARRLGRKAHIIQNALDLDRFASPPADIMGIRQSLSIPNEAQVVGTVGRLTEEKGYPYLLDAAALVLKRQPQTFYLIIGGGPLDKQLQEHASQLGISNRVLFTGPRSDIECLLACMDVFVCSSLWEGLPTAVLEGMAAGVPVIASDIPGTRILIRHAENGWLVPPGNSSDLAAAIIHLLETPQLRRTLSLNAAVTVQDNSIDKVAKQHESLYRYLLNDHE